MSLDISGKIIVADCTCPNCNAEYKQYKEVFEFNITGNLRTMAREAKIDIIWGCNDKKAWQLIEPLRRAIEDLKANKGYYDKFAASNGWGTRVQFIEFITKLCESCENYPNAILSSSY